MKAMVLTAPHELGVDEVERPVPKEDEVQYWWAPPQGPGTNVAQAYARFARDYREGTHFCPTFEDAVTRHRMLNAIETAAATGQRQTLG